MPLRRSTGITRAPEILQVDPEEANYCNVGAEKLKYPRSHEEGLTSLEREKGVEAMNQELESLDQVKTWTLVPKEGGMKTVKWKWIFRIRRSASGRTDKYKARLVAVRSSQVRSIDHFDTFSSVLKLTSLRMLLPLGFEKRMRGRLSACQTARNRLH